MKVNWECTDHDCMIPISSIWKLIFLTLLWSDIQLTKFTKAVLSSLNYSLFFFWNHLFLFDTKDKSYYLYLVIRVINKVQTFMLKRTNSKNSHRFCNKGKVLNLHWFFLVLEIKLMLHNILFTMIKPIKDF